jgi:hypothetical protein
MSNIFLSTCVLHMRLRNFRVLIHSEREREGKKERYIARMKFLSRRNVNQYSKFLYDTSHPSCLWLNFEVTSENGTELVP